MRVVALLAVYNEERFISGCLAHLIRQGLSVYLIDNASTDRTVAIAERYAKRGLVGIETMPRDGVYRWKSILERKEHLAATLDGDWFLHVDADEIRLPPRSTSTLAGALADVDAAGYNAVNFLEFAFVPTREQPDHDHPKYLETMRWYYPFLPWHPSRLNAWKRQPNRVDLASSGGHAVHFPGLRMYPESFRMRHYLFLSAAHALEKWGRRVFDREEVASGWHAWRAKLGSSSITLPSQSELYEYISDDELNPSNPRTRHILDRLPDPGA